MKNLVRLVALFQLSLVVVVVAEDQLLGLHGVPAGAALGAP